MLSQKPILSHHQQIFLMFHQFATRLGLCWTQRIGNPLTCKSMFYAVLTVICCLSPNTGVSNPHSAWRQGKCAAVRLGGWRVYSFIKWKEDYWGKEEFTHPSRSQADKLLNLCWISGNRFPKTAGTSTHIESVGLPPFADHHSLKPLTSPSFQGWFLKAPLSGAHFRERLWFSPLSALQESQGWGKRCYRPAGGLQTLDL